MPYWASHRFTLRRFYRKHLERLEIAAMEVKKSMDQLKLFGED